MATSRLAFPRLLLPFVLCLASWCTANVRAEVIDINKLQQEARVQGNVSSANGGQQSFTQTFHPGTGHVAQTLGAVSTANTTSPVRSASAQADQLFPSGSYVIGMDSLLVNFDGSTSGAVTNAAAVSDNAAVFDTFCVSFTTSETLLLEFSATVTATGDLTPTGQITDGTTSYSSLVSLEKTGGMNPFTDFVLYDNATVSDSLLLPAGSYHLITMSAYNVPGVPNGDTAGSTSYSVDMSITAVPEPSLLGLVSVGVAFLPRHRRRANR